MYSIFLLLISNIFSVLVATKNGANIEFKPNSAMLKVKETKFKIRKKGKLYYLNNVISLKKLSK